MNYRITLAYDGTDYQGWQLQDGAPTVQGVLTAALSEIDGAPVVVHGAGRTDAGVHAAGQVASFHLQRTREGDYLRRAINGNLPPEIRVLLAEPVYDDFHARFSALGKTYRYQIYVAEVMTPFLTRYAFHHPYQLDASRLREDGHTLVGTHDFSAFTVAGAEVRSHLRTLNDFRLVVEGPLWSLYFSGDGFLRYQVRTMVGALLAVNRERLKVNSIAELIAHGERSMVGAPAPARGLTLMKVEY